MATKRTRCRSLADYVQRTRTTGPEPYRWINGRLVTNNGLRVKSPTGSNDDGNVRWGASYYATPYTISLLKVVWADPELWRRVARNAPSQEITLYIKRRYRLIFPNIPAKFWKALAKDQAQRGTLFDTIALQSWRVISPEPELATRLVMQELSDKRFFRLVAEYLSASGLDCKSLLASQEFSSPAIRAIKSLGKRLFEDAEWCLKCVGQIPPTVVRNRAGQPWDVQHAATVESLVSLAKSFPDDTNHKLAERHLNEHPHLAKSHKDTLRKAAGQAKLLARFREGAAVRFHEKR